MKIIIAPAKKMIIDNDTFEYENLPQYLDQTKQILHDMRKLTYHEARELWNCSDKLAEPNYQWLQKINLKHNLTPALLAFSGIQYQYMAPDLFTEPALDYVRQNLRILSGFYGILRPFDGVVPYRLEMQSKLKIPGYNNLYDFWNSQIYEALSNTKEPIVNLASQEYAKTITPYLKSDQEMISVVFGSLVNDKLKIKATLAKMARGEMVRFMAENNITQTNDIKKFNHPNWKFSKDASTNKQLIFIHTN
ncbi:peroxide stress protein YaaA [Companilactobacillus jidongensis]|uniref:peroxide stress protein YaaA n=1 Tax=Companilactobacillus jidongensis TaxID=2486006 RepID=UPI000F78ED1D|nr:peroxide stress protein YaaA [Companilactobacillus jidongensis]